MAFGLGANVFASFEQTGEGVHWHNVDLPANADELVTMGMCIRMLWLDALIYGVLTWYIEAVFPGKAVRTGEGTCPRKPRPAARASRSKCVPLVPQASTGSPSPTTSSCSGATGAARRRPRT